jgi:hypothetical protein
MGAWGSSARPGRFTPGKNNLYPLYRRLGWPRCQSGRMQKASPPPGIDHLTVCSEYLYRPTIMRSYINLLSLPANWYPPFESWPDYRLSGQAFMASCVTYFPAGVVPGNMLRSPPSRFIRIHHSCSYCRPLIYTVD